MPNPIIQSLALAFALASSAPAFVTLEWVTVGDAGNANASTGYGGVTYQYDIMKYEVSQGQWAAFINSTEKLPSALSYAYYETLIVPNAGTGLPPEAINARVADRAKLIADAKRILPTLTADALDEAGIRRAVVSGKLGDAAKDMDDAAIAGAYVALMTGMDDAAPGKVENLKPAAMADTASVRDVVRNARYN